MALLFCGSVFAQSPNQKELNELYDQKMAEVQTLFLNQKYEEALALQYTILSLLEKEVESPAVSQKMAENHGALARIYMAKNDSLSLFYADKSIEGAFLINDYSSLYNGYSLKYHYHLVRSEYEFLLALADSCLLYAEKTGDDTQRCEANSNKAIALIKSQAEGGEVIQYIEKAVELLDGVSDDKYPPLANNLGNIYIFLMDEDKGRALYHKSYEKALELGHLEGQTNAAYNLFASYFETKEYDKAFEYNELFTEALEQTYVNLLESKFNEANSIYEVEKKDKEIAQQHKLLAEQKLENLEKSKQKQIYLFGAIVFAILLLTSYIIYRLRSENEKKQVKRELDKAREFTQLRTRFLENIAHEIRTPLTLTKGYIALCQEHSTPNSSIAQYLSKASSSADKILENADDLLNVLKEEGHNFPLKKGHIQLNHFLEELLYSFSSISQTKRIELVFNSSLSDEMIIHSDRERIEKIVTNFISNALKFSPTDHEIILEAQFTDKLVISVQDFGLGIAADEKEKVFDRFYQSEMGSEIGGMGIGLSLANEFAESLGGELQLESDLGKGCKFSLVFPVNQLEIIPFSIFSKERGLYQKSVQKNYKRRILVVEDEVEMNKYICHLLHNLYDVNSCYSGDEAYELIKKGDYDLILSDIMMPRLNGIALKEKLNALPELKAIPFIFLSAKSQKFDVLDGLKLGVDDYITKPFDHNELYARIKNLIANKEEREKNVRDDLNFQSEFGEKPDEKLLAKINKIIYENIENEDFKIEDLAAEVGYSQRQLARIMKKVVGMTLVKYILELRLQMAYTLLKKGQFSSLSEVRYSVGITSSSYFTKKFIERFGLKPAEVKNDVST